MIENRTAGLLLLLGGACGAPSGAGSPTVLDVTGAEHTPLDADGARANVLLFTTVDCPIANGYAPEIAAIARDYEGSGLRFFLVHVDPAVSAMEATTHSADYGLALPILLDPEHALVAATGITVTPEAAIVGADGELLYRGRIDDLYADLGRKRRSPTTHDLRDALDALVAGRDVPRPRTDAVGCFVADLK